MGVNHTDLINNIIVKIFLVERLTKAPRAGSQPIMFTEEDARRV
jgi:hypothetical protein